MVGGASRALVGSEPEPPEDACRSTAEGLVRSLSLRVMWLVLTRLVSRDPGATGRSAVLVYLLPPAR